MRILFLCLGNICRSPAAEGVFRKIAGQAGLSVQLDSAGTGGWHVGEPPYAPMQQAAAARGYDLSQLRARKLQREDFARFDLILAMDGQNLRDANALAGGASQAKLQMFLPPGLGTTDVPDPYYSRDFTGALQLIEKGSRHWVQRLQGGL
ncbi:phosphotyrosine protein phosphatase [Thioclava sp. SK-1]|uniref:low molecular weight protein-tyrosine-phosphatase n=1 Tax=Thioclava sp. SK-1 TaxID=1889770 RepID=UPI0008265B98|nr:low molecular weight protein-tyrosine-phosphatase [Thioclava sp. SK-1]OCX61013.1 phosphotyrosine protein phosphatase [Thioclava sp. SK-1]